ncbi:MAG: hypothetical protein ICV70_00350 [Jiangellaceae bacterium]|nr:hypothetical protein [Jiangellaceae bacterium]
MPDRLGMRLSRRALVAGAVTGLVAGLLAACTGKQQQRRSPTPAPGSVTPDERLRRELVAAEQRMLALYAATAAAHPGLAARLDPFQERHRRHLTAIELSGAVASPPASTSAPSPGAPSATGTSGTAGLGHGAQPAVPADAAAAVAALRAAEQAAAAARLQDCLRCTDDLFAELVAAVGACEAAHGSLLAAA